MTLQFEKEWSDYTGCKYSVFVNSGSSANLLMAYACQLIYPYIKDVIIPAVAWATSVSPFQQFGYKVHLCDIKDDLTIDISQAPAKKAIIMLIHPLGVPCDMHSMRRHASLKARGSIILEDSCEAVGSEYRAKKTGSFGLMSSFSFYYGHHISTIEGGMICTSDKAVYELLLMLRSHGWDRDVSENTKKALRIGNGIDEFRARFTMYVPAFNVRATDLQAFIGLRQILKLKEIVEIRQRNFMLYDRYLNNPFWKLKVPHGTFSNFAYPVIHPLIRKISEVLKGKVDHRPLICGNIARQPFFKGTGKFPMADIVHDYGMYLPNNPGITKHDIIYICDLINQVIEKAKD